MMKRFLKSGLWIIILFVIVALVVFGVFGGIRIILPSKAEEYVLTAELDSQQVVWFDSAEEATENVSLVAAPDENGESHIIFGDIAGHKVTFTMSGEEHSWSSGNTDYYEKKGTFEADEEQDYYEIAFHPLNYSSAGEVIVVKVSFSPYENGDTLFRDRTTKYMAFKVPS